jgi:hypothetical protein
VEQICLSLRLLLLLCYYLVQIVVEGSDFRSTGLHGCDVGGVYFAHGRALRLQCAVNLLKLALQQIRIILNMLMPVKHNSFTHLRVLLVLTDRGILGLGVAIVISNEHTLYQRVDRVIQVVQVVINNT